MGRNSNLTPKLRQNWWVDALLGISSLVALLTSIYFLIYPEGGYQGGRNPYYNIQLIFNRYTWDALHTWSGVLMIMAALWHIVIHWRWITGTISRTWKVNIGKRKSFGLRLTYNIILDATIAVSFLICAISSINFLIYPNGGQSTNTFIISRYSWDMLHTWSGVVMTIAALLHFALHWKWVVNITGKLIGGQQKRSIKKEPTLPKVKETV